MRALLTLAAGAVLASAASNVTYIKAQDPAAGEFFGIRLAVASTSQYFISTNPTFSEGSGVFYSYLNNKYVETFTGGPNELLGGSGMDASPTHLMVGATGESSTVTVGDETKAILFTGTQNTGGTTVGGAHLYDIDQTTGALSLAGVFKGPSGGSSPKQCGRFVAIDGNTAVLACPDASCATPLWVFTEADGTWSEGVSLMTTYDRFADTFGKGPIALSGNYLAVMVDDVESGNLAIEIFINSGTEWKSESVIPLSFWGNFASGDYYPPLTLQGTLLVVGNYFANGCTVNDNTGGCIDSGEAFVYRIGQNIPQAILKAPTPLAESLFGLPAIGEIDGKEAIFISAEDATCGSGLDPDTALQTCNRQSGTVYVYTNTRTVENPRWRISRAVKSLGPVISGNFGYVLDASKGTLVVGAPFEGNANGGVNPQGAGSLVLGTSGAAYVFAFDAVIDGSCTVTCNDCVDFSHGHAHDIVGGTVVDGILVTCAEGTFPTSSNFSEGETCSQGKTIVATCVPVAAVDDVAFAAQVASFQDEAALAAWLAASGRESFLSNTCVQCSETVDAELFTLSQCLIPCVIAPAAATRQIEFETGFKTIICDIDVTLEDCARAAVCAGQATAGGVCGNITCPSCSTSSSKKGLLGLLGLLGLIPLLLCCCLLFLCCIRRKKADPEVHFATFDPYAQEQVLGGSAMICSAAPALDSVACASGTVVYA